MRREKLKLVLAIVYKVEMMAWDGISAASCSAQEVLGQEAGVDEWGVSQRNCLLSSRCFPATTFPRDIPAQMGSSCV